MGSSNPPRDRRGFHIALICALRVEADCVQAVFDKFWEDEGKRYGQAPGDQNNYTTGVIGEHNVVLAYMPNIGKVGASGVAASLRSSFPEIKLALVVGICGGVPFKTDKEEILLGDIIISQALVQFDFGRQYPGAFEEKNSLEDSLGRPSPKIRGLLAKLQTYRYRSKIQRDIKLCLKEIQQKLPKSRYPGAEMDKLYEAFYLHKHHESLDNACDKCAEDMQICPAARRMTCDELGCEENKLVIRNRLPKAQDAQNADSSLQLEPMVHFGKIGSGDKVMKCAEDRDRIAEANCIIAFEMEGAGVWDHFPSIVIKAVCDYADSHKNKQWQEYAAATAAACMKAFLIEWTDEDRLSAQEQSFGPLWCVPFDHIQEFVGRRKEIEALETKLFRLHGCQRVAVLGLGGVGKSRIALELAYRTKSQRSNHSVFWIRAMDSLTFENDIYEIGKKLQIQGIEDDKSDVKNLVKQRLGHESMGSWLIILDNADDEAIWGLNSTLTEYLPDSPMGSVLVTTRNRRVATNLVGKESIELHEMEKGEAIEMLRNLIAKPEILTDLDVCLGLLDRLTYLPLAIVQAAAYINLNDETIQVYIDLLNDTEDNVIELLSEDFQTKGRYKEAKNPVATTWLVSFEQIQRQSTLAADYISFISCLSETGILESLLPDATSKKKMIDALGVIKGYFFLWKRNNSDFLDPLYDMHRLVRLATRSWLKSQDLLVKWTEIAIKQLAKLFPTRQYKNKDQWILYMPHAQILCDSSLGKDLIERYFLLEKMGLWLVMNGDYQEAVRIQSSVVLWRETKLGKIDESTWEAYNSLGEALREQGDWTNANKYHKQALEGQRFKLGAEHPDTLTSMANLASTYRNQGRWKEAEQLDVQVMEVRMKVLGAEHPDTLTSMNNLASTYRNQGRWKEAEQLDVQVTETRKRVLGAEHPDTLTSMANLASTFWDQGRWKETEELNVQVTETRKRVLGAKHPDTLTSMANLASTFWNQGRWKEAEELNVQVMETRKRVLGEEHPDTLTSINNLASTFWNQGRWKEAEELDVRVIETSLRVLGAEHPDTLTSMANLASTYRNQGRWKEAEELNVQVMETRRRVLGAEHPSTLTSMANLASTYRNQGRWKEAEELFVQVMETSSRVLGAEHPNTLTSINNLASTYRNQGRWKEAEELFVQVMETSLRVLGVEHPDTLTSVANLASTLWNQGRWKEAEELEVQVMETSLRVLGEEHPDTLTSINNLASTFWNQGQWKEAEELNVQVMETSLRVLGAEHPDTLTSMNNLASTYRNQGRWKEAEELFVQVMETRKRVLGEEHPSTLTSMNNLELVPLREGK